MLTEYAPRENRSDIPLRASKGTLAVCLLCFQLLPPFLLTVGFASSMALGTSMASAAFLCFYWISIVLEDTPRFTSFNFVLGPLIIGGAIVAVVTSHMLIASFFQPIDVNRGLLSIVPLLLLITGGLVFGQMIAMSLPRDVDWALRCSFTVLCIILIVKLLQQYVLGSLDKTMIPFAEPSHFALAFIPIYMYASIRSPVAHRIYWIIFGILLALTLQSVALVIGCIFTAASCKKLSLFALAAMGVVLVGVPLNLEYFSSRLDFSGSVLNLSNLVFVQGWQMIGEALIHSQGWGVGFQQMGVRGTDVPAAALIHLISDGEDFNLTDGGFVFSKIASEFGILGILLSIGFIACAGTCIAKLRRKIETNSITFGRCVIVSYSVDMFFRGPGYFVESTFIFAAAIGVMFSPIARVSSDTLYGIRQAS